MKLDTIGLPYYVMEILDILHVRGYGAFVVGGCCRDIILGIKPHDYDIATSALPEEMIEIFKACGLKTILTGLQHGTITVMIDGKQIECTTFRIDGEYSDGRRPDRVLFAYSVEDDLMRRDFTMNAIAYSPWHGIVDPFGGIKSIQNKTIRCVGKAENRFKEDGLRIMRAIRFAAQLGFEIDEDTSVAIHNNKHLLDNISKERIQSELVKMLMCDYCANDVLREYSDVICRIIPEIEPMVGFDQNSMWHIYDVWEHTLHSMDYIWGDTDIITRLAVLLHDIGKPHCYELDNDGHGTFPNNAQVSAKMAYKVLKDLKFSNEIVGYTTQLISYHDTQFDGTKLQIKRLLNEIGETQLRRLIALRFANLICGMWLRYNQDRRRCEAETALDLLDKIIENGECYSLKQFAITGDDLIDIGFEQGKEVGKVLKMLLEMVMCGELENNKEDILEIARAIKYNIVFE